jgi:acyl-CoA reductase-like NAD-dependent aldehyde dehydrogenase
MDAVADALVEKVVPLIKKLSVGMPEEDKDITPVISSSSADFIEEARKMSLDVSPMSGEEVQALMNRIYATPADVIRPVKEIMASK